MRDIFNPVMFGFLSTLVCSIWFVIVRVRKLLHKNTEEQFARVDKQLEVLQSNNELIVKKVEDTIDQKLKPIKEQADDNMLEVLRLQILDGIDTKRLSESEVLYFYDKYKRFGGNSFVTSRVEHYLEQIRNED